MPFLVRVLRRASVACALLSSCAPASAVPASLPSAVGAYPREQPASESMTLPRRAEGWAPAADVEATIEVEAPVAAFLRGLPHTGTVLPLRPGSWPAAVRLASVGSAGATLTGAAVALRSVAADIRCPGETAAPVRLVAEVVEHGPALMVRVRYEGPEPALCEVSSAGRRRLQGVLADVYLWARRVARAGTEFPAAYR